MITIEKKEAGYLLTRIIDTSPNESTNSVDIFCNDFCELIKNLSIYLESKYITVSELKETN